VRLLGFLLAVMLSLVQALAAPIETGAVQVVDGDTIRAHGVVYRLIGLDAPETGSRARCTAENAKGGAATQRLRQLVAGGGLDLEPVRCACQVGTEGTFRCNYGRSCGVLRARGRDAAEILIGEGLARPYICGATRCPRRESWCE
jgi:endonuclease YncB( thermonuclease family)